MKSPVQYSEKLQYRHGSSLQRRKQCSSSNSGRAHHNHTSPGFKGFEGFTPEECRRSQSRVVYSNSYINKEETSEKLLELKLFTRDGLTCSKCSLTYSSAMHLEKHLRFCQTSPIVPKFEEFVRKNGKHLREPSSGMLMCPCCPKLCLTFGALRKHILQCKEASKLRTSDDVQKLMPCPECSSTFMALKALLVHLQSHYIGDVSCSACDKVKGSASFNSLPSLVKHLKVCARNESYNCNDCQKQFQNPLSLKDHVLQSCRGFTQCLKCAEQLDRKLCEDHVMWHLTSEWAKSGLELRDGFLFKIGNEDYLSSDDDGVSLESPSISSPRITEDLIPKHKADKLTDTSPEEHVCRKEFMEPPVMKRQRIRKGLQGKRKQRKKSKFRKRHLKHRSTVKLAGKNDECGVNFGNNFDTTHEAHHHVSKHHGLTNSAAVARTSKSSQISIIGSVSDCSLSVKNQLQTDPTLSNSYLSMIETELYEFENDFGDSAPVCEKEARNNDNLPDEINISPNVPSEIQKTAGNTAPLFTPAVSNLENRDCNELTLTVVNVEGGANLFNWDEEGECEADTGEVVDNISPVIDECCITSAVNEEMYLNTNSQSDSNEDRDSGIDATEDRESNKDKTEDFDVCIDSMVPSHETVCQNDFVEPYTIALEGVSGLTNFAHVKRSSVKLDEVPLHVENDGSNDVSVSNDSVECSQIFVSSSACDNEEVVKCVESPVKASTSQNSGYSVFNDHNYMMSKGQVIPWFIRAESSKKRAKNRTDNDSCSMKQISDTMNASAKSVSKNLKSSKLQTKSLSKQNDNEPMPLKDHPLPNVLPSYQNSTIAKKPSKSTGRKKVEDLTLACGSATIADKDLLKHCKEEKLKILMGLTPSSSAHGNDSTNLTRKANPVHTLKMNSLPTTIEGKQLAVPTTSKNLDQQTPHGPSTLSKQVLGSNTNQVDLNLLETYKERAKRVDVDPWLREYRRERSMIARGFKPMTTILSSKGSLPKMCSSQNNLLKSTPNSNFTSGNLPLADSTIDDTAVIENSSLNALESSAINSSLLFTLTSDGNLLPHATSSLSNINTIVSKENLPPTSKTHITSRISSESPEKVRPIPTPFGKELSMNDGHKSQFHSERELIEPYPATIKNVSGSKDEAEEPSHKFDSQISKVLQISSMLPDSTANVLSKSNRSPPTHNCGEVSSSDFEDRKETRRKKDTKTELMKALHSAIPNLGKYKILLMCSSSDDDSEDDISEELDKLQVVRGVGSDFKCQLPLSLGKQKRSSSKHRNVIVSRKGVNFVSDVKNISDSELVQLSKLIVTNEAYVGPSSSNNLRNDGLSSASGLKDVPKPDPVSLSAMSACDVSSMDLNGSIGMSTKSDSLGNGTKYVAGSGTDPVSKIEVNGEGSVDSIHSTDLNENQRKFFKIAEMELFSDSSSMGDQLKDLVEETPSSNTLVEAAPGKLSPPIQSVMNGKIEEVKLLTSSMPDEIVEKASHPTISVTDGTGGKESSLFSSVVLGTNKKTSLPINLFDGNNKNVRTCINTVPDKVVLMVSPPTKPILPSVTNEILSPGGNIEKVASISEAQEHVVHDDLDSTLLSMAEACKNIPFPNDEAQEECVDVVPSNSPIPMPNNKMSLSNSKIFEEVREYTHQKEETDQSALVDINMISSPKAGRGISMNLCNVLNKDSVHVNAFDLKTSPSASPIVSNADSHGLDTVQIAANMKMVESQNNSKVWKEKRKSSIIWSPAVYPSRKLMSEMKNFVRTKHGQEGVKKNVTPSHFSCELCPLWFYTLSDSRQHVCFQLKLQQKLFPEIFDRIIDGKIESQLKDTEIKPQNVALADGLSPYETYLQMKTKTRQRWFYCDKCQTRCKSFTALLEHKNSVHTENNSIKCHVCGKEFSRLQKLAVHFAKSHKVLEREPGTLPLPNEPKNVTKNDGICDNSEMKVTEEPKNSVADSMKSGVQVMKEPAYHKDTINNSNHESEKDDVLVKSNSLQRCLNIKSAQCEICNKTFSGISGLKSHMNQAHASIFKCPLCLRRFTYLHRMKVHYVQHFSSPVDAAAAVQAESIFQKQSNIIQFNEQNEGGKEEIKENFSSIESTLSSTLSNYNRRESEDSNEHSVKKRKKDKWKIVKDSSSEDLSPEKLGKLPKDETASQETETSRPLVISLSKVRKSHFSCEECNESFKKRHFLAQHRVNVHKNISFACPVCNLKHSDFHHLDLHLKQCEGKGHSESKQLDTSSHHSSTEASCSINIQGDSVVKSDSTKPTEAETLCASKDIAIQPLELKTDAQNISSDCQNISTSPNENEISSTTDQSNFDDKNGARKSSLVSEHVTSRASYFQSHPPNEDSFLSRGMTSNEENKTVAFSDVIVKEEISSIRKCNKRGIWKCEECQSVFYSKGYLERHNIKQHGAPSRFNCMLCHRIFTDVRSLRFHHKSKHGKKKWSLPPTLGVHLSSSEVSPVNSQRSPKQKNNSVVTTAPEIGSNQMKEQIEETPEVANIVPAGELEVKDENTETHVRQRINEVVDAVVELVHSTHLRKSGMEDNCTINTPSSPQRMESTNRASVQVTGAEYSVSSHLKKRSRSKMKKCEKCNEVFRRNIDMARHKRRVHRSPAVKCHLCGLRIGNYKLLKIHLSKSHNLPCAKEFSSLSANKSTPSCRRKRDGLHREENRTACVDKNSPAPDKTEIFKCMDCTLTYRTFSCLKRHRILVHAAPASHYCDVCGKGFSYPHSLKNHMLTHSQKNWQSKRVDRPGKAKASCDIYEEESEKTINQTPTKEQQCRASEISTQTVENPSVPVNTCPSNDSANCNVVTSTAPPVVLCHPIAGASSYNQHALPANEQTALQDLSVQKELLPSPEVLQHSPANFSTLGDDCNHIRNGPIPPPENQILMSSNLSIDCHAMNYGPIAPAPQPFSNFEAPVNVAMNQVSTFTSFTTVHHTAHGINRSGFPWASPFQDLKALNACTVCGFSLPSWYALQEHYYVAHPHLNTYQAPVAQGTYQHYPAYNNYEPTQTHLWNAFQSQLITNNDSAPNMGNSGEISSFQELNSHSGAHCSICGLGFSSVWSLQEHYTTHMASANNHEMQYNHYF